MAQSLIGSGTSVPQHSRKQLPMGVLNAGTNVAQRIEFANSRAHHYSKLGKCARIGRQKLSFAVGRKGSTLIMRPYG
jgi:hypothetical protein